MQARPCGKVNMIAEKTPNASDVIELVNIFPFNSSVITKITTPCEAIFNMLILFHSL